MMEFIFSSLDMASVSISVIKVSSGSFFLVNEIFSDNFQNGIVGWQCFYVSLLITQLFLIGWTCNEVKVQVSVKSAFTICPDNRRPTLLQSEAIGDAIFQSRWYLLNKDAKMLVAMAIARSRRHLEMTVGPFGPMTTNSIVLVSTVPR